MTASFRRVPYPPDPRAPHYWEADEHASAQGADEATRIDFDWWFTYRWAEFPGVAAAWAGFRNGRL